MVKTVLIKIYFKLIKNLKHFISLPNQNHEENVEKKKSCFEAVSNFANILKKISPIQKGLKIKFFRLCLNFQDYQNLILSTLNEEFLCFMKKDYRMLHSLTKFKPDSSFRNDLVVIYFCLSNIFCFSKITWLLKGENETILEVKQTLKFLREILISSNDLDAFMIENIFVYVIFS